MCANNSRRPRLFDQLMVGSRYHELIESADSIVSMKETGTEVLCILRDFPTACANVLEQVRMVSSIRRVLACFYVCCLLSPSSAAVELKCAFPRTAELCITPWTIIGSRSIGNR